jgi:hypothetical protein
MRTFSTSAISMTSKEEWNKELRVTLLMIRNIRTLKGLNFMR